MATLRTNNTICPNCGHEDFVVSGTICTSPNLPGYGCHNRYILAADRHKFYCLSADDFAGEMVRHAVYLEADRRKRICKVLGQW